MRQKLTGKTNDSGGASVLASWRSQVQLALGSVRLGLRCALIRGTRPCGVERDTRIEPINVLVFPDQNDVKIDAALDQRIRGVDGDPLGAAGA